MSILLKGFRSLIPYLQKALFGEQSVKHSLNEHWFAWLASLLILLMFMKVVFITEQSVFVLEQHIKQTHENQVLRKQIDDILPSGIESIEDALNLSQRLKALTEDNLFLNNRVQELEAKECKPTDTLKPVLSRSPTKKPAKPKTTHKPKVRRNESSLDRRLERLPEI